MHLVTAGNGNQGKLLVPKLLSSGLEVRACVQSERSADHLRSMGADVVVGDISEPETLARALKDVEKIYHIGPSAHPKEREMGLAIINAARESGVRHFVFSSVLHAISTALVQHEIKRDIEERLVQSGLEYTILQPANYMMPLRLQPVFKEGVFKLSWSLERRQSLVDLEDVTDVAVLVLTESDKHAGATYELVGEGRYTAHELGQIISSVLGRTVSVEEITPEAHLNALFGDVDRTRFTHQIRVLRAISAHYSTHDFIGNSNVLQWLLGRRPTSFEAFVRRHYERWKTQPG